MSYRSTRGRRDARDDDESPRRGSRNASPNLVPLFALLGLAAAGIVIAGLANSSKPADAGNGDAETTETTAPKENWFEHIDWMDDGTEADRRKAEKAAEAAERNRAPEGLEATALWQAALTTVARAKDLSAEADEARKGGDERTYNEKAVEARDILDQVLEDTALWEEDIVTKYGDVDLQVRRIMKERSKWFDLRAKYRKAGLEEIK